MQLRTECKRKYPGVVEARRCPPYEPVLLVDPLVLPGCSTMLDSCGADEVYPVFFDGIKKKSKDKTIFPAIREEDGVPMPVFRIRKQLQVNEHPTSHPEPLVESVWIL